MENKVYIFGHQNPDTDSTCSAIAYAHFKNTIDSEHEYIPVILGEINKETKYVLDYWKVKTPIQLNNLKPQVSDIEITPVETVKESDSIQKALRTVVSQVGRSIPIVDQYDRMIGIVSISDILPLYLDYSGNDLLEMTETPIENIIETLELEVINGSIDHTMIRGKVLLYCELCENTSITKSDILFCDLEEFYHTDLLKKGAGTIIIANVEDTSRVQIDEDDSDTLILASKRSLFDMIKAIGQAMPIASIVKKENLQYFATYETIDDVKKNMLTSKYRRFPVVNEWGHIRGMISRSNLVEFNKKKAILVDHNERGQSIEGIDDVDILEVIDHHRVADIQTIAPLYFRVEPLGCTCTIIAKMFEENSIPIDQVIAGLMLSAILSDTLLFKSPTCTQEDRRIANKLAEIAEVKFEKYGIQMITKGSTMKNYDPEKLIYSDMKKFMFGKYKVMISQINTGDFEGLFEHLDEIKKVLLEAIDKENYDLVVLMVTDIVIGGTELIALGEAKWIAENAFNMKSDDESMFLYEVFSRKKQVVPKLMKAARL